MSISSKSYKLLIAIFILDIVLIALNLLYGSVSIPFKEVVSVFFSSGNELSTSRMILFESRWPQTITALLSGAALSVAGLLMQTLFRNPLAGPGILGISSGASLGVAILTMLGGAGSVVAFSGVLQSFSIVLAAFIGAFLTLALVLFFASFVKNNTSLLIIGMMVGYGVSSVIGFLQFAAGQQQLHSFVIWGLGSFSHVSNVQLPLYSIIIISGILFSFVFVKPLNALLLGDHYAANLGVQVKKLRIGLIIISGLLTAIVTAYAGPIAFIGLAVPHLTRMLFNTSDHRILMPALVLNGMAIALACNFISRLPSLDQALPINIVTSVFGAPLVIWFLVKNNRINMG